MKRLLAAGTIGLVVLAMAVSSTAAPVTPQVVALQRRVEWQDQHIRQLQHRRSYLHGYIRHLRREVHAPVPVTHTSTSTTTTTTTSSSNGSWADELRAVGFPESSISTMLYYISRESGGNPNAINPSSGACGLLQLYPCLGGSAWLDPMTNLRLAFQKYQASGFAPWGG